MQGSVGWLVARGYYFSIQFAAKQDHWRSSECFCLTTSAATTCYCYLTFQVFVEGQSLCGWTHDGRPWLVVVYQRETELGRTHD